MLKHENYDGSVFNSMYAFPEDLYSIPSTHITQLTTNCNSSSRKLQQLWPLQAPPPHTHTHTETHKSIHTIKTNKDKFQKIKWPQRKCHTPGKTNTSIRQRAPTTV